MKKILVFLIVVIFLLTISTPIYAQGSAETGHFSDEFLYTQDYIEWGPANYYKQDVHVVYKATNTWTWVEKEDFVKETLVQNGVAEIYDITGTILLDTRPFSVIEKFEDQGKDVAKKFGNWWSVSWTDPYSDNLEFYHYVWKIQGVYRFEVWNKDGERIYHWRSPDKGPGWDVEHKW